jgi:hypothetical protein
MPSKNLQPALIGGLFIGILSALPIIKYGNCLCCLWVVGGGIIAAYFMQQASAIAITVADGALGGLLAGLIGTVISAVLNTLFGLMLAPIESPLRRLAENNADMPPWLRDALANSGTPHGAALQILGFVFGLCIYVVFSTIGGMIGAAIFNINKRQVVIAHPPDERVPPPPGAPTSPPPQF